MKKIIPLVGVLALAGIAYAASIDIRDSVQWLRNGMWILPSSMKASTTTANKVTKMWNCGGRVDYDFPAIGPGGAGQAGGHLVSNNIPCTGALLGDKCSVQSTGGDGGILPDLLFTCYPSAADTVILRVDALLDDAGSPNPSDAGYYFYMQSQQ